MEQWEESELFGEGYLTRKTSRAATKLIESASVPATDQEEAYSMENRLPRPMHVNDAPPNWRCNARKSHCPEGVECRELIDKAPTISPCACASCMLEQYPYLEEGAPYIVREKARDLLEADYVGLYEPERYTRLKPLCVRCGREIKIDGGTAARFARNDEEIVHVSCLSEGDAKALHEIAGGAFALPYIIRKCTQQEELDETEGTEEGNREPQAPGLAEREVRWD